MAYVVFVRNLWRWEVINHVTRHRRLVSNPGAKRTKLATVSTYDEARDMCDRYNSSHKPGPLSRKAEFTAAENY